MHEIAICHDYLTQRGGAERAVLSLSDAFPEAPIHTSVFLPEGTFEEFSARDVRPSIADRVPAIRTHFRAALPLYPAIFGGMQIDAEVTLCSSSGWAHGVRTTGQKIVYCHAPARWLYQTDDYLQTFPGSARWLFPALKPALLHWDRRAASSADLYLANSRRTRDMIWDAYGIDAEVLPPPHTIDPDDAQHAVAGEEPGFFLTVSRLLGYKHVVELVEAFRRIPSLRLLVVGEGPLEVQLAATCPDNVRLLGRVTDAELRWLYANASALVAVAYEDLGLTPVEAALFGTPCIALRFGGYLDTVIEGVNGRFIDSISPGTIREAVTAFDPWELDPDAIRITAERYSRSRFEARLAELAGRPAPAAPTPSPLPADIDLELDLVLGADDRLGADGVVTTGPEATGAPRAFPPTT